MKVAQHNILSVLILVIFLSACSPAVSATALPTSTSQPTITPTVITMEQNVEAFLSGEFDNVSNLSLEERKEFSIQLAQKMNDARGAKPLIYKNEAYVDPITGMMKNYNGHPDLEETIQMYLAARLDSEGNLLIQNEEGTWVKINGSKDIDWNMVVTDPNDPRIDWPTGHENKDGFSPPQIAVKVGSQLVPMVMLDNNVSQLYMSGENALMQPTITLLKIETDSSGIPILARKVIIWGSRLMLCKEGSEFYAEQDMFDSWADGFNKTKAESPVFKNFKNRQAYLTTVYPNQPGIYEGTKLTPVSNDYENVVDVNKAWKILTEEETDRLNMLIIDAGVLIQTD